MIKNGTWKSEPANEDGWDVDWSIAEPDPEFLPGRDYSDILFESKEDTFLPETESYSIL